MQSLSIASTISLYILLAVMALYLLPLIYWQWQVLQGNSMANPDGSVDDWHQQRSHYGMAFADLFIACPLNVLAIILVFVTPVWGFYALTLVSFWWLWAGVMATSTSLRFEHPKITFQWIITFPLGAVIGLAYIVWSMIHLDQIFVQ